MKIGIVGRGSVAQALALASGQAREIRFGVRSVVRASEAEIGSVAQCAEVIPLATPWVAEADVCRDIADHAVAKTVIDATKPVRMRGGTLNLVHDGPGSAAKTLLSRLLGAHVVKCLNQIGAEFIADPGRLVRAPVMFAGGDDAEAKAAAPTLAKDAKFEAVDGGPLSIARHLEELAMIWIWSAIKGPPGRTFGFALSHARSEAL